MHPLTFSDTHAATFFGLCDQILPSGSLYVIPTASWVYFFEANLHYDCILFEFMIAIWNFEGWSKFAENCQLRTFSSQQLFVDPFVLAQHQTFPFLIRERKKKWYLQTSEVQNMTDICICAIFSVLILCLFKSNTETWDCAVWNIRA